MAKILFIASKYDYAKPELGLSYEYYNFYDSLVKMDNGHNEVVYFPFDEISLKAGRRAMNQKLLETIEKEKPDLCFFFLFGNEMEKEVVGEITRKGFLTINWFADDHYQFYNYSKYWAPYFNWVITTEQKALEKYYKIGYRNVILSQWACNHFLYKPLTLPKIYGVSFVGHSFGRRKTFIKEPKRAGIKIDCFGRGWPNGKISQEEMIKTFSQTKVNLNFAKTGIELKLRTFGRIFFKKRIKSIKIDSPALWFDNLRSILAGRKDQITGRIFEVLGCAGFLLTNYADGLERYYEIGKEIVCYQDTRDLIKKIGHYLKNEKEREAIAKAGYQRTIREHTYEKRFREIFDKIGLKK